MNYESLRNRLSENKNCMEQLFVYEKKDRAQELLIEELSRALQLFVYGEI